MADRRLLLMALVPALLPMLAAAHIRLVRGAEPEPIDVTMVVPEGDAQKYWPRWRGPSGQGLASGKGYPDAWSGTDNVRWRALVPGRGHSSPIVWADHIFLTTAHEDGRVSVLAFRRSDGKPLWETFAPDTTEEHIYKKNSHASATPSTDGQRIYGFFGNKGMLAVDLSGRLLWHRSLGNFANYHGTAGSPLLYKDRLILYQDQRPGPDGGGFIAAFDRKTGKTLWRTERQATVGWGTPVAVRVGDKDEIVVNGQRRVNAYDPDSGEELWSCGGSMFEVIPTPVVGHGLVFCSSGRAGPTLAIRPGGRGDVSESHLAWKASKGSPFVPSPLVYGDLLYMVNDMASIATCYEAKTGAVVWQGRLGQEARESFSASLVGVDGKVFFTNDDGETFVVRAGREFQLLGVNRLNAKVLASPALVDGRFYFRTDKELLAIGR